MAPAGDAVLMTWTPNAWRQIAHGDFGWQFVMVFLLPR
jgi:hypothetical protein